MLESDDLSPHCHLLLQEANQHLLQPKMKDPAFEGRRIG